MRASYLVSRALTETGQAQRGLVSAERALTVCQEPGIGDFDLAYALRRHATAA